MIYRPLHQDIQDKIKEIHGKIKELQDEFLHQQKIEHRIARIPILQTLAGDMQSARNDLKAVTLLGHRIGIIENEEEYQACVKQLKRQLELDCFDYDLKPNQNSQLISTQEFRKLKLNLENYTSSRTDTKIIATHKSENFLLKAIKYWIDPNGENIGQ